MQLASGLHSLEDSEMPITSNTLPHRLVGGLALLSPLCASAAPEPSLSGADTAWVLTSTALVLFMTLPGLALFYGGLVRNKNVLSMLMQCFAIAGLVSLAWLLFGYSIAFGTGNAFIGDLGKIGRASCRERVS
jgi:Amt family ammonium transporter